ALRRKPSGESALTAASSVAKAVDVLSWPSACNAAARARYESSCLATELSFATIAVSSLKLPSALTTRLRTHGLSLESSAAKSTLDAEAPTNWPSVSAAVAR